MQQLVTLTIEDATVLLDAAQRFQGQLAMRGGKDNVGDCVVLLNAVVRAGQAVNAARAAAQQMAAQPPEAPAAEAPAAEAAPAPAKSAKKAAKKRVTKKKATRRARRRK